MKRLTATLLAALMILSIGFRVCALNEYPENEHWWAPGIKDFLNSLLSEEDKAMLSNSTNSTDIDISDYPVAVKVYKTVYYDLATHPLEELVAKAEQAHADLGNYTFYLFGPDVKKILVSPDPDPNKPGVIWNLEGDNKHYAPNYIFDLALLHKSFEMMGETHELKGVYCFDRLYEYLGAAVYLVTDKGTYVKYYDRDYGSPKIYTVEEFGQIATAYWEYYTSYERNYDADGNFLNGGTPSFFDFAENYKAGAYDKKEEPAEHAGFKWLLAGGSVFLGILVLSAGIIIYRQKRRKTAC